MRRGPHAEWPGSVVFIGAAMGVYYRSNVGAERLTAMCVQLVGDSSWWRSFGGLSACSGCGFGRGTVLVMTARVAAASLALLPGGGGVVSYCVRCSRALFVCGGVRFGS
jgi:hypothetical protein